MASAAATDEDDGFFSPSPDKRYALSGKIMLVAIVVLLFVVILMICLHLYVRLCLLPSSRRQSRRRRRRHPVFVFTAEPRVAAAGAPSRGLPQAILKSLPVFVHSGKPDPDPVYCAVCLSEFEEKEMGRIIPRCNHSFHVGCIDMWFYSHVTCPLCRSEVKPESGSSNNPVEMAIDICGPGSMLGEEEPGRGNTVELVPSSEVDDTVEHGTSRVTTNFVKSLSLKKIMCGDTTERHVDKEEIEAVHCVQ